MSSDPDPLTHVPGSGRSKPASSQPTVTPCKTTEEPSPEVQLSLRLATPETKLVDRVRSPEYLGDSSLSPHVAGKLFCAPPPPPMATDDLSDNWRELLDAQARRISELEQGREALALQVHDLSTMLNRVVDICIKYDDFASLRDLQQDSAEAPTKPVKPETSACDSALEDSVRSPSAPTDASEASDGPESVPDNPAGEDKIKINELKFSAQPQRKNKRGSPPQSVRVPYPESPCHYCETPDALGRHHWTSRCPHKAPCCHCGGAHSLRQCPDPSAPPAPPRPKRSPPQKNFERSAPKRAQPPRSNPPSEADQNEIKNTGEQVPELKKPPRLQFNKSACIVKGCKTTLCKRWWTCPDTCIYASARGPPDVNPHKNDCVCDPCRERYPQLKGTFSQQRPTGHVETAEVVAPTDVVPNTLPTAAAKPPQPDDLPEAVEGPTNIAPLDAIADASPATQKIYRTAQHACMVFDLTTVCVSTVRRLHTSARLCV